MKKVTGLAVVMVMVLAIMSASVSAEGVMKVAADENGNYLATVVTASTYILEGKEVPLYSANISFDTGKPEDTIGDFYGGGVRYHVGPDNHGWLSLEEHVAPLVREDQELADRFAKGAKINGRTVYQINQESGGPGACHYLLFDNEHGNTLQLFFDGDFCNVSYDEDFNLVELEIEIIDVPNPENLQTQPLILTYEDGALKGRSAPADHSDNPETGDAATGILLVLAAFSGTGLAIIGRKRKQSS